MEYKVIFCDTKTSQSGKEYKTVTLEGVEGNVSVWPDFPQYAEVVADATVTGELLKKGIYTNLVGKKPAGGNFGRSGAIKQAQDRKENSIKSAQENKEQSIKVASTMRGAIDIALAAIGSKGEEVPEKYLEERIRYWRQWLWLEWDKSDSDFPPFA